MKFIFSKQVDTMDCGPSCLQMVARHYGKFYSLQYLRAKSYLLKSGVSLLGISEAAESIGLRTRGYKLSWEQLRDEVPLPCIVHWNQKHFIVVYEIKKVRKIFNVTKNGFKNTKIKVADPAFGLIEYSENEFLKFWNSNEFGINYEGAALLLEPTPEFYKKEDEENQKLSLLYLVGYIRPYSKFISQIFLGILTASLISLILPFLTQSLVDTGIGNNNTSFIIMVLIAQLILSLSQTANGLLRNWISLHVTSRVSISLISDFLIKLMKLPASFFDSKLVGDIMQRIGDHNRIRTFLTDSFISIIFAIVTFIIYAIVIASYSIKIFTIFLLGSFLYIGWVILFLKRRRELDYKRFQQSAANQNNIVQLITGMQEIKLNTCEKQKRWEWERIQIKLLKISLKSMLLSQNQQIGAALINQTKDIVISFLCARSVIRGEMTLGMMMAVQYIIGQLNSPIQQFISFTQSAQDARISIDRLAEIHNKTDEEKPEDGKIKEIPSDRDLEIKDLCFQYEGPHSEKVINNINLNIPAKKITAIVGKSGSGKTTLLKIILGFYNPVKGEILLGGIPLNAYSQVEWRKKCGVVMQEGFIFSDTIADNIGLIDETPNHSKIYKAVETANIKEFIEGLPLNYNTKIGNEGHGLSTGQKQRLLIARAVYKQPDFIFFDEATNSLDAENEKTIMSNLRNFFNNKTVIIVAHRLSTVKNADQIIILEKGEIVEKGSHNELVEKKGAYFSLIKDQLELGE